MVVAYVLLVEVVEDSIPSTFREAELNSKSELWRNSMMKEIKSLYVNDTWELLELPKGKKDIGCKWAFVKKDGSPNDIVHYKSRFVTKGYAQRERIDYSEIFSPVVNH